jgi:hypothetical protein
LRIPIVTDADSPRVEVELWDLKGTAADCGDSAGQFFSEILQFECRLAKIADFRPIAEYDDPYILNNPEVTKAD